MTYKQIKKQLDKLYKKLEEETSSFGMELVGEIVDLEIEAEKYCNQ